MKNDTWVLLADGSRAQLYLRGGKEGGDWTLLREFTHEAAREEGWDLVGNRPNQIQHGMEVTYKSQKGTHQVHEQEADRFARELCDYLHGEASRNAFGTLVIAAPPKFMGQLKSHMSKPVLERVSHFLNKDYTDRSPRELAPLMTGL